MVDLDQGRDKTYELVRENVSGLGRNVLAARREYDLEMKRVKETYRKDQEGREFATKSTDNYLRADLKKLVRDSVEGIQRIREGQGQDPLNREELEAKVSKYAEVVFGVPENQKGEEKETSRSVRGLINAAISRPVVNLAKAVVTGAVTYGLAELIYAVPGTMDLISKNPGANFLREFPGKTIAYEILTPHYTAPGLPFLGLAAIPWAFATGLWIYKGRGKSRKWKDALDKKVEQEVEAHTDGFASDISQGILTEEERYKRIVEERLSES